MNPFLRKLSGERERERDLLEFHFLLCILRRFLTDHLHQLFKDLRTNETAHIHKVNKWQRTDIRITRRTPWVLHKGTLSQRVGISLELFTEIHQKLLAHTYT